MGYTHYFRGWVTLSEAFTDEIKRIIAAANVPLANWEGEAGTEPEIEAEVKVSLNGVEDGSHETFHLDHGVNHRTFCKTARKEYDVVVATILLRASMRSRGFKVGSDGDWNEEQWLAARSLYTLVFDELPVRPSEMHANALV